MQSRGAIAKQKASPVLLWLLTNKYYRMYTKSSGVEKYSKGCANEAFCSKDNNRVCKAATESSECDREFEKKKGTAHSRKHNQVVLYQLKTQSRQ